MEDALKHVLPLAYQNAKGVRRAFEGNSGDLTLDSRPRKGQGRLKMTRLPRCSVLSLVFTTLWVSVDTLDSSF